MIQLSYKTRLFLSKSDNTHFSSKRRINTSTQPLQMAVSFVPVPLHVKWTGMSKSGTNSLPSVHTICSNCETIPLENRPFVRGHQLCGAADGTPISDDSSSNPRGRVLVGSPTLVKGEGRFEESWKERSITPTLLDYKILESRAKFTVYKILVTGRQGRSWLIFRRYTDFCRLSDELKELFPGRHLPLPPRRWFRDNYEDKFLEQRQIGLQMFLHNLMLHKDIFSSKAVTHFLSLVDPQSPFGSLEKCRAFCETLEETNHRLHSELLEKEREADALKQILKDRESHINLLLNKVKSILLSSQSFEGPDTVTDMHIQEDRHINDKTHG